MAKEKGRAFFVVIVGGSHEIYAGRRNQTKVEGPFDSLRGIDDGLFVRSITKGGGEPLWSYRTPRFFCIVRGPAAAEQRGIAAPSPGAIPGPSSRRRAGPEFRPDQTLLCLSCSHARRPEDLSCPGLDKYVDIFVGPGRESQSIFSRIPYHATHGDLSIDR